MTIRNKVFVTYTVLSALAVWLGLTAAESRAQERCALEGMVFRWTAWRCVQGSGTIILPAELKRA